MEQSRKQDSPSEVSIKKAKNGGFIVRHMFDNMGRGESYRSPEEHAFTTHKDMISHIVKHTGSEHIPDAGAGATPGPKVEKAPSTGGTKVPEGVGVAPKKGKAPGPKTYGAGVD